MSLLDDVSIVVTPNGYKAGELYAVVPVPTEGAEEVTNGDFATDSGWSKGGGATISGGQANIDGDGTSFASITQSNVFTEGKRYKVTADVIITSGLGLKFQDGANNENIGFATTTGFYEFYFIATSNTSFVVGRRTGGTAFDSSIDNVSVKEYTSADMDVTRATAATRVDENGLVNYAEVIGDELVTNGDFSNASDWDLSYGTSSTTWSISDGKANATNSVSYDRIAQVSTTPAGTYKITINISSYTSGTLIPIVAGQLGVEFPTEAGVHTQYITGAGSSQLLAIASNPNFTGSIDNVSVKEVTRDNVPRIDYTGGGCPHILAEPMRTNLLTYSEDFTNWNAGEAVVVSNQLTSPSGEITADKFNALNATNQQYISLSPTVSSGSVYTLSCFAKKGEINYIALVGLNPFTTSYFDLNNGTLLGNTATSSSIEDYGNGWYRCTSTFDADTTSKYSGIYLSYNGTTISNSTNISNGEGVYIYGAQLEAGSYATSYIPNFGTTAGVTRNQDIFTRDGIGSLINSTEGVLFVELENITGTDATNKMISITDGSLTNKISLFVSSNQISVESAGSGTNLGIYSKALQSGFNKIAVKYKVNDCALWVNGTEYTDTSFAAFTSSTLNALVFDRGDGTQNLFGKVKQLQVYTTALTDTQLAALTS